jgi:hypothetical protein
MYLGMYRYVNLLEGAYSAYYYLGCQREPGRLKVAWPSGFLGTELSLVLDFGFSN